jgi:hypothetical protein
MLYMPRIAMYGAGVKRFLAFPLGVFLLAACYLFFPYPNPWNHGIFQARQGPQMQTAHAIGLAMYSYAHDHEGNYPSGKSSTEVFQALLDGDYATDPAIFYFRLPGKSAAAIGQKLKPENVCWDFTSGATIHSPVVLPLVFTTGYRVTYAPAAAAVPVIKPYPVYPMRVRTWAQWWRGEPAQKFTPGIAAFYISNSAKYNALTDSDSVPAFISSDFVSVGETYRQLTPDGILPPTGL